MPRNSWFQPSISVRRDGSRSFTPADSVGHMLSLNLDSSTISTLPAQTDLQKRVSRVVHGKEMQVIMGILILFSCLLVMIRTDAKARGENPKLWETISGHALLSLFVLEMIGRLVAERAVFFCSLANVSEFIIVAADVVVVLLQLCTDGEAMVSFAFVRILRLVRLSRVMRLLSGFRELFMMLHGLQSATKAICWSVLLCAVWMIMWSILAVEFIRPLAHELTAKGKYMECSRCGRAFDDLWSSCLTLIMTIICGDSWGQIAIPMMENYPLQSSLFFLGSFMTINVGLMNLIMAVIVDRAAEARTEDEAHILDEKIKSFKYAKKRLKKIFEELDTNGDGHISWMEFRDGVQSTQEFAELLSLMDVDMQDLAQVYLYCDIDHNGEVSYTQFIRQLYRLKTTDSHTILVLLSEQLVRLHRKIEKVFPEQPTSAERRSVADLKRLVNSMLDKGVGDTVEITDFASELHLLGCNTTMTGGSDDEVPSPFDMDAYGSKSQADARRSKCVIAPMSSMFAGLTTVQEGFDSSARLKSQDLLNDLQKDVEKLVRRLETNVSSMLAQLPHGSMQDTELVSPGCKSGNSEVAVTIGKDHRDPRMKSLGKCQRVATGIIAEERKMLRFPWDGREA